MQSPFFTALVLVATMMHTSSTLGATIPTPSQPALPLSSVVPAGGVATPSQGLPVTIPDFAGVDLSTPTMSLNTPSATSTAVDLPTGATVPSGISSVSAPSAHPPVALPVVGDIGVVTNEMDTIVPDVPQPDVPSAPASITIPSGTSAPSAPVPTPSVPATDASKLNITTPVSMLDAPSPTDILATVPVPPVELPSIVPISAPNTPSASGTPTPPAAVLPVDAPSAPSVPELPVNVPSGVPASGVPLAPSTPTQD
ncbi:hypothetical protein K474DRAFT_366477 [Panus rudis PR-1116 ss-1]|nr:hypothetical protein K474DRAFT_366477 [Panus rudis PR-1116 ss-1]